MSVKFWKRTRAATEWDFPPYPIWQEHKSNADVFKKCVQTGAAFMNTYNSSTSTWIIGCDLGDTHLGYRHEDQETQNRHTALKIPREDYAIGTEEEMEVAIPVSKQINWVNQRNRVVFNKTEAETIQTTIKNEKLDGKFPSLEKATSMNRFHQDKVQFRKKEPSKSQSVILNDADFLMGFQKCLNLPTSKVSIIHRQGEVEKVKCIDWPAKWWHLNQSARWMISLS